MRNSSATTVNSDQYGTATTRLSPRNAFTKRVMQTSTHDWQSVASARLEELVRLPDNWDGYGAKAIGLWQAHFVMNMLNSACPSSAPCPQIVPGSNGDVQVEWHTLEYDIELHVTAPFQVDACRFIGDEVEEIALTNEFSAVARWLIEMENAVAARPAAA